MAKIKIYLSHDTQENEEAFEIISWLKSISPNLEISVINPEDSELPDFIKGSDGPIYEISGYYLHGNPSPEQLRSILYLIARQSIN